MTTDAPELVARAYAARRDGDSATSLELYRQAEAAFGDDAASRAHCLRHIGDLAHEFGRTDDARTALSEAEAIYRGTVADPLSLANTVRLLATLDDDAALWREARALYAVAADATGLDMQPAFRECDRRLQDRGDALPTG